MKGFFSVWEIGVNQEADCVDRDEKFCDQGLRNGRKNHEKLTHGGVTRRRLTLCKPTDERIFKLILLEFRNSIQQALNDHYSHFVHKYTMAYCLHFEIR